MKKKRTMTGLEFNQIVESAMINNDMIDELTQKTLGSHYSVNLYLTPKVLHRMIKNNRAEYTRVQDGDLSQASFIRGILTK